ncbi:cytochrome b561 and DOMON domain-containing protein At5g35735 [Cryptomeria japonica]|uniref:cytochrome b561 and DOMON domain-containing protein At5g35735 n=1 Tax=Cryptomeria japonica TaxID=3369 RepID=UPI0027D9F7DB|nr:cytochrome b561 and DOMON domain-containing protein At5g35735 [Cryptomeria japonica]
MMGRPLFLILGVAVLLFGWDASAQSSCPVTFTGGEAKTYQTCNNLQTLGATLAYTYVVENGSLDIAFQAAPAASGGWVAWGINPQGIQMIGTQALIAFRSSNGSTVVGTYNVQSKTAALNPSSISLTVTNKSAVYESSSGKITIFASLVLTSNQTSINQVWQVGSSVTNSTPAVHSTASADLSSLGTLDLRSGTSSVSSGISHQTLKNRHGVLTVVSWGILMPIGIMIARYAKTFKAADPAWFYLHAFCQTSGYIIGVSGWGTGLRLGSYSKGVEQTSHRRIGIALFCFATLQIFALFLRPNKNHKFRIYWNIYHHSTGYTVIILSIINIFKGFDILDPEKKWKNAYIGVLIAMGVIAAILEVVTWIIFFQRKSKNSTKPVTEMNGISSIHSHV